MDKKKKAIEDEALDQVTGGNGGGSSTDKCPGAPNGQHVFAPAGFGVMKCKYCPLECGAVPGPNKNV